MRRLLLIILLVIAFPASAKAARPNFVVFQVDDMPRSVLGAQYFDRTGERKNLLPNINKYLLRGGMQFADFAASSPVCSPSRAALLSGHYSHNNKVVTNSGEVGGSLGWMNSPSWDNNMITRLQEAGYHTGHFGKWINQYGEETDAHIPPGWNTWVSDSTDASTRDFYGYYQRWRIPRLGIDKTVGPVGNPLYGPRRGLDSKACRISTAAPGTCNYHTDLMSRMAGDEISASSKPFYFQIDYHTPHGDAAPPAGPQPASRHLDLVSRVILPRRQANFNEKDTSDKDYLSQKNNGLLRRVDIKSIETHQRNALAALKAVDEGVGYIARILENNNLLSDTYLVFLSDNGFFYGNHRFLFGKIAAYESSSKVPFLISGPSVQPGSVSEFPASTVDFAPTVVDLAGAKNLTADGESLLPALGNPLLQRTRPRLIQTISPGEILGSSSWNRPLPQFPLFSSRPPGRAPAYRYRALQIDQYKYLSYDRGGEELYNLDLDPFEMNSIHRQSGAESILRFMRDALVDLRNCQGDECLNYSG